MSWLAQMMHSEYENGDLDAWMIENRSMLENHPEWRDGKVALTQFYCDNILGSYNWWKCPPEHKGRMDALIDRTGYQRTLQTVLVQRWIPLDDWLRERSQEKLKAKQDRLARLEEMKKTQGA